MDDTTRLPTPKTRREYAAPQVTRVHLRPEEAVLGACKNGSASGPGGSGCATIAVCSSAGS
jgi:hypothetical protein